MSLPRRDRSLIDIVVAFYRNPQLVEPLCESLWRVADELMELGCSVIALNDSPDDLDLRSALAKAQEKLGGAIPFQILENEKNLGFVRSVNRGLQLSIERGSDAVLLNSDTLVFPGAFRAMMEVAASDPMIGFVSPRSNNATICSFPPQEQYRKLKPSDSYQLFKELSPFLPKKHLVPTAVGFCLYIKQEILAEFGLFDEIYGCGYNEENDLIMRANRCGFRSALANHAFVYHFGEVSFGTSETPKSAHELKNSALLNDRYPEYLPNVQRYFAGPIQEAERLLIGLLPDRDGRRDLLFDFSSVGPYHNGTFEAAKEILRRAPQVCHQFNVYVMASDEARRFHRLDELEGVTPVPVSTERKFAVALRFGQPFSYEHVERMGRLAPVNVYGMLDPIAFDCLHLYKDELEGVWSHVFEHADGVIYISDFVQQLFRERFSMRGDLRELVAYLSLDYRDYRSSRISLGSDGKHILVVGNSFAHKRVPATVDTLSQAFPFEKIVTLGMAADARQNVIAYASGNLPDKVVDRLFQDARFIVFPSVYEGFGFPVVRSLALGKPVLARRTPVAEAIQERVKEYENLVLYSSPSDLVRRLQEGFPKWRGSSDACGDPDFSWDRVTQRIAGFLEAMPESVCFARLLKRLKDHTRSQIGAAGQSIVDMGSLEASAPAQDSEPLRLAQSRCEHLAVALRAREREVDELRRSWSWRITAPLRRLGSVFVGQS